MKLLRFITLIALIGFISCDDILNENPRSEISVDQFYNTPADAVGAVNAVYHAMYLQDNHGRPYFWPAVFTTDDSEAGPGGQSGVYFDLLNNNIHPTHSRGLSDNWRAHYILINRANTAISKIPDIEMDENLKDRLIAEARFFRAKAYFRMVYQFGDVPLITTPYESLENLNVERTPVDAVYDQIIEDLTFAENNLWSQAATTENGRATTTAAKGLLARVHLTRENWDAVVQYTLEIINAGENWLMDDFPDVFRPETENNEEIILALQFMQGSGHPSWQLRYYLPRDLPGPGARGLAVFLPSQDLYDSYEENDLRRDWTIADSYTSPEGVTVDTHLYWHKFMDYATIIDTASNDTDMPLIRYADILLMYAEALNETSGPTEEAYESVNMIRRRAYGEDINNPSAVVDLTGLTQDEFREAVWHERRLEFAGEYLRRLDLVRTQRFITVMSEHLGTQLPEHRTLLPIPQGELDVNPSLTQNPGF